MRWMIAAALLSLATPAAAATERLIGTAPQAAAVVDAFHAALHRGDTKGAALLLSDDAIIFEEGHAERSKSEYAAHHLPADAEFSRAVSSTITRRTGRGDGRTAWVASEGRYTGTFKGTAYDQLTTETMVLRRTGSSWKIAHIHWSSRKRAAD